MYKNDLQDYLWPGLNLNRYEVIKILPQDRNFAAIIMKSRNQTDTLWCLEYIGNGHYFDTKKELLEFYEQKFKRKLVI